MDYENIISEHKAGTQVFSSMLIAYVSFKLILKKFKNLEVYNILRLPNDELEIQIDFIKKYYKKTINSIRELESKNKIKCSKEIDLPIEEQIKIGCENLGLYHPIKPIILEKNKIQIKNIKMLFYYHNRLTGFNLKKIFIF